MVRTAEHKLRPRGLFRAAKAKGKQRDKKPAAAAKTNGATAPASQPHADGRAPLPNSTVRPRQRPRAQPQSNGMHPQQVQLAPPPPPHMHQEEHAAVDFAMMPPPPPMPPDFAPPHHEQHPQEPHGFAPAQHELAPPPFDAGPPQLNGFDGPPPPFSGGPPPPPAMMDQFTAPSQPEHYLEPPAPQSFPPPPPMHAGNGAHAPFNGFEDPMPPMGEHAMPPLPPAHAEPFEPNPLLAALANERPPDPPASMFAPQSRPPMPTSPRPHVNGATNGNGASHGAGNGAGNGVKPAARRQTPDFSGLPPAMAESLAKLAGVPWPPRSEDEEHDLEAHSAEHPPGAPRRDS
jgi:hypothetical protein